MTSSDTLSFCIFDGSRPIYGPIHSGILSMVDNDIRNGVATLINQYMNKEGNIWKYIFTNNSVHIELLVDHLCQRKFYVYRPWETSYAVAFAINYTRFKIGRELIHWRENDEYDPIAIRNYLDSLDPRVV